MSSNEQLLNIQNVTKRFGELTAADSVSFILEKGDILGLIGPNGAGKTTLVNLITGLHSPDSGNIYYKGENILDLPPHERTRLGIGRTFQLTRVFNDLTVWDNITSPPTPNVEERALEYLKKLEMEEFKYEFASDLSYGQKKLVELMRLLVIEPSLVILDEPAAGTNPKFHDRIVNLVNDLNKDGKSFILIEHEFDLISKLCNNTVALLNGKKVAEGTPHQIRKDEELKETYFTGGE